MTELSEKAKSKAQQRFFGMVRAAQKGEMKNPSKEVLDVADDISVKDAKDFAKTKHKGLPNKKEVKEGLLDVIQDPAGAGKKFGGASGKAFGKEMVKAGGKVAAIGAGAYVGSKLVGKMIDGKKKKSKKTEVKEEKKGRHPRDQKELDKAQEYIKKNPNFGKKEVNEKNVYGNGHNYDAPGVTAVRFKVDGSGTSANLTHSGGKLWGYDKPNKPIKPTPPKTAVDNALKGIGIDPKTSEVAEGASILKVRGKRNTYMGASGDHKRDKEGNIEDSFYKKKPAPTGDKWKKTSYKDKPKRDLVAMRASRKARREKREAKAAARAASQSVNEGRLDKIMDTVRAYSKKRKADAKKKPTMDSTTQKLHKWRKDKEKDEKRKYVNDVFQ